MHVLLSIYGEIKTKRLGPQVKPTLEMALPYELTFKLQ